MKKFFVRALISLFLVGGFGGVSTASASEIGQPETAESEFIVFPEIDIDPIALEIPVENDGSLYQVNPLLRGPNIPRGEKN